MGRAAQVFLRERFDRRNDMTIFRTSKLLLLVALVLGTLGAARADSVFNFDSDTVGKSTSFFDTNNGVTADFVSSNGLGGFQVAPSFFKLLTGNVLLDPGPAGLSNLALIIGFSSNLNSIFMDFATDSLGGVPFTLTAFENGTQVGQLSASGAVPPGFTFSEGTINFGGPTFNAVSLSSTALFFAIDNVDVKSTPEPSSLLMLGTGLLALIGAAKSRLFTT